MNNLIIIAGPCAAGKDTLLQALASRHGVTSLISHTTRPKRPGETDGKDYFFVKEDQFLKMKDNNEFYEVVTYVINGMTYYYGLHKTKNGSSENGISAVVVNPEGAEFFVKEFAGKTYIIYMDADELIRKQRAFLRGNMNETLWEERCKHDRKSFTDDSTVVKNAKLQLDNTEAGIEHVEKMADFAFFYFNH